MKDFSELTANFHRGRLEFVHTELDTGVTFAQVADTERKLGNTPRAAHNLTLAENACAEAKRRLDECASTELQAAIYCAQSKLATLEAMIVELRRLRL